MKVIKTNEPEGRGNLISSRWLELEKMRLFIYCNCSGMRGYIFLLFLWTFLLTVIPFSSLAGEDQTTAGRSQIVILSPKEGKVIPNSSEIKIEYRFIKGLQDNGDHVHVYLDGQNEGTSKRSPRILGKLSPGKHTVTLRIGNHEHDFTGVEATVHFEVTIK